MAKQSKKPADLNRLAAAIVGDATDETRQQPESSHVAAGRLGGKKGGKVRAERMTAAERYLASFPAGEVVLVDARSELARSARVGR